MSLRGINERLISRPSYFDSLLDNLQFIIYPSPGILFDLAKSRSITENIGAPIFGYANDGTPGVQCSGVNELWPYANTSDIRMRDSAVGVGDQYTFWLWVYVKAVNTGVTDSATILGSFDYTSESINQGWQFAKAPHNFGSDGTPRMYFFCYHNNGFGSYAIADTSIALAAGQIHQYVMNVQFDSSTSSGGQRLFYRDNALRNSPVGNGYKTPPTSGMKINGFSTSNDFLVLGFGVWNRTLTASERQALYNYPELLLAPNNATSATALQRLFRPSGGVVTAVNRRTLSPLGTRIGSRQGR